MMSTRCRLIISLLRSGRLVGNRYTGLHRHAIPASMNDMVDVPGNEPARDGTDEPHNAVGLTEVTVLDCLYNNQEGIVDLVVDVLDAQLAAKIQPNASAKGLVELLHSVGVACPDTLNKLRPVVRLFLGVFGIR